MFEDHSRFLEYQRLAIDSEYTPNIPSRPKVHFAAPNIVTKPTTILEPARPISLVILKILAIFKSIAMFKFGHPRYPRLTTEAHPIHP